MKLRGMEFVNRIPSRIFVPKRDENMECNRIHNEELHSLNRSPNIVWVIKCRRLKWAGILATSSFKILTGEPIREGTLARSSRGREANIRIDLK